jgi:hypothetical protein
MAFTVIQSPEKYCFVGNSVVFELQTMSMNAVEVKLTRNGEQLSLVYFPYQRENNYIIKFDLADYLTADSQTDIPEGDLIIQLPDFATDYRVEIGQDYTFEGIALQGGIPNHEFQSLRDKGWNIFSCRLCSSLDQFLFTTRTSGTVIKIKKSELFPFVFIHPGVPIVFKSNSGSEVSTPAQPLGTFCAMDMNAVLKALPENTTRIDVCPSGQYAFRFLIQPEKLSAEKYWLRFRNSLGAIEVLEITGKAMHTPEFSEERIYETLSDSFFYEERRLRLEIRDSIEVETGYRERSEFPFILNMIQSHEIYFVYPDGDSFRCHVTANNVKYRHLMTEPTSIKLKIRAVTEDSFVTPDSYQIFDDMFDETHN